MPPLLDVKNLRTCFYQNGEMLTAVDGISFSIEKGQTLGLVGESGCGKTVTALSILRLLDGSSGRVDSGSVLFRGTDLLTMTEKEMNRVRGRRIAMIFQDPMTSLNPVFSCGDQIREAVILHTGLERDEAIQKSVSLMKQVGIAEPNRRYHAYPHEMSGGMRQRVMIAMALAGAPELLIADEPTTALDVTVQAQILNLIKTLQADRGMAILMITHDLGVISETVDEVAVMYAGRIVEYARVDEIFERPRHPYTIALSKSVPQVRSRRGTLEAIEGTVPYQPDLLPGCKFHDRCDWAIDRCAEEEPDLVPYPPGQLVRCWRAKDIE